MFTSTNKWIEKTVSESNLQDVYKEFYTDETVRFMQPKGDPPQWVNWVRPPLFGENHTFGKSYVSKIKNGSVWMCHVGEGVVYPLAPDSTCFHDMVFHQYWRYFSKFAVHKIPSPSPYHGNLGVLAWAGHSNYWHWLHDTLGRYHLLERSGFQIDKYVLPPLVLPFQQETVKMLGIPEDKILQLTPGKHLRAKNLILPSIPFKTGTCVKWTVQFIRHSFLSKATKGTSNPERIYISRDDASWRKIANESKLMAFLETRGFRKVSLSSLTVQEQIDIFSSAKVIISPNGAGLANIMFCQEGAKVIQLFTSTSDEFIKIGQYLGLDYHLLKCRIANPASSAHEVVQNLVVDVKKLSRVLDNEGIV